MLKYFFICMLTLGCSCNDQPLVKTPLGEVVGYFKTSFGGRKFSAFEGIPFAKPPVGQKRFEEPSPTEPWHGVWNATILTTCAQTVVLQPNETLGNEDCLHINVYVPRETPNPSDKLDVMVHIHGGAFMHGSGNMFSRPDFIIDGDIIFVSFNYRLGVFGFLSTEDDVVPGNNGLKDQTVALKWVQDNIASFGGNPDSITITGLSAGGASVHLHYFSNSSKGLFHRGVSHSGVALNTFSVQEGSLQKTQKLADAVGCPVSTTRLLVDCLKERPYQHLLDKMPLFYTYFNFLPIVPFGPVVEKGGSRPFLSVDPYELLTKGQVHDVPWIASTTTHEGLLFVANFLKGLDNIDKNWEEMAPILMDYNYTLAEPLWKSTAKRIKEFYFGDKGKISMQNLQKVVQLFSDRYFLADAETAVRLQAKINKSPVYYYTFGYPGDHSITNSVPHGADSKYFFNITFWDHKPFSENELKMKDLLVDMLVTFAKTGKARIGDVEWKPTAYDNLTYLTVDGVKPAEIQLQTTEGLTTRKFWTSLNFSEGANLLSKKANENV